MLEGWKNALAICLPFWALVAILLLQSCTTPAPIDVQVQCLPMTAWSLADLAALDKEFATLQDGHHPETLRLVEEYLRMRDADRACIATTTKGK